MIELLEVTNPGMANHTEATSRTFSNSKLVPAFSINYILFFKLINLVVKTVYFSQIVANLRLKFCYFILEL